jgi:hypothetical protein
MKSFIAIHLNALYQSTRVEDPFDWLPSDPQNIYWR